MRLGWGLYASKENVIFNSSRPRQNGRHFADDTLKRFFLNGNVSILIKISLNFVPKGPFNNIPALVQIMACGRPGDKPLCEPMMVILPTHICVTCLKLDMICNSLVLEEDNYQGQIHHGKNNPIHGTVILMFVSQLCRTFQMAFVLPEFYQYRD